MVEFFTESKDEGMVIEEARSILSGILKEADASKQKRLLRILLDGFKTCYVQFRGNFRIRVRPIKHEPDSIYINKYMKLIEKKLFV